jgi:hypothetical protein
VLSGDTIVFNIYLDDIIGTGHYYFDEMRRYFNLVQNQLFALTKLNIYSAAAPTAVQKKRT